MPGDQPDLLSGSPGCVGDGVSGPRAKWLYVVPSDRTSYFSNPTSSGKNREEEIRESVEFVDALMSYATGPWREQHLLWYCSGETPVVEEVTIGPVGNDNQMTLSEIHRGLRSGIKDRDLHPLWLNLGPGDCVALSDGTCDATPFIIHCGGPSGAGLSTEVDYGFSGAVLFGDEAPSTMDKYTAVHETFHCVGAPDLHSHRDTHDIMSGFSPKPGSSCELVQLDCNKDQWYSSLLAAGGSVPQWLPEIRHDFRLGGSNSATSIYLTPITSTSPTVYCDGTEIGTEELFDEAADSFRGDAKRDVISLFDGDDLAYAGKGNDKLCGGDGNDHIYGQGGADVLVAAGGNDELYGGPGDDVIYDGYGSDRIVGGRGRDVLYQCFDGAIDKTSTVEIIRDGDHCRGWNFELLPEMPPLHPLSG